MGLLDFAVNPISAGLDELDLGAKSGLDSITGRGASKDARAAAQENNATQLAIAERNIALQREFAQMGIRWRVEDATAAGIHPLAALGASGASFSPVSAMTDPLPSKDTWKQNLGQNVRGYVMGKIDPVNRALGQLSVDRAQTENALLKLELANKMKGQAGPVDTYLDGQGNSLDGNASIIDVPLRRVVSDPHDPSKEVGAIPDYQVVKTNDGWAVVPAQGVKQAIEDSPMEYQWLIRAAARTYRHPEDGSQAVMNPLTGRLKKTGKTKAWMRNFFFNKIPGRPQ